MGNIINLNAPIIPNLGAGDMELLTSTILLRNKIVNSLEFIDYGSNKQGDWIFEYDFPNNVNMTYRDSISFKANILSGLIVSMDVFGNYKGLFLDKIVIGSTVKQLLEINLNWVFDENYIYVDNDLSLIFEIDTLYDINSFEEVMDFKVTKIMISNEEFSSVPFDCDKIPSHWLEKLGENNR
jgi:hypothetical protein